MWAVIGGFLVIYFAMRLARPRRAAGLKHEAEGQTSYSKGSHGRIWGTVAAFCRRRLLPESLPLIFGHVTRLQLLVLGVILAYLLVFS